jgi:hypothetical protein
MAFNHHARPRLGKLMAQWRKMAQFHPLTSKNPLRSSARAIGGAKLCLRLTKKRPEIWRTRHTAWRKLANV